MIHFKWTNVAGRIFGIRPEENYAALTSNSSYAMSKHVRILYIFQNVHFYPFSIELVIIVFNDWRILSSNCYYTLQLLIKFYFVAFLIDSTKIDELIVYHIGIYVCTLVSSSVGFAYSTKIFHLFIHFNNCSSICAINTVHTSA